MRFHRFVLPLVMLVVFSSSYVPAQATYFPDVPTTNPAQGAIEFLYKLSIVEGNPDGNFAPTKSLNRAEFAKLVILAEQLDTIPLPKTRCFEDVPVDAWYAPYVCKAKELGYLKGDNNEGKVFHPERTLVTAETLAVMDRQFQWNAEAMSVGESWYQKYVDAATGYNVLPTGVIPEKAITRAQFAEVMARTIAIYDFELDTFSSDDLYDEYFTYDTLTAADCQADETFDTKTSTCIPPCIGGSCGTDQQTIDTLSTQISEPTNTFQDAPTDGVLAIYQVKDGQFTLKQSTPSTDPDIALINTKSYHEKVWDLYKELVPEEQRRDVVQFQIVTDGEANSLASVELSQDDPDKWILSVDIRDSFSPTGEMYRDDLVQTLIHEFAHILTLRAGQLRLSTSVVEGTVDSNSDCKTYAVDEGCALLDSYIYPYYKEFWSPIVREHPLSQNLKEGSEYDTALENFYIKYQDRFVTDYAATNPEEDMAETFVFFVIKDKPTGTSIADQKIRFFWNYPALLMLRSFVRGRV